MKVKVQRSAQLRYCGAGDAYRQALQEYFWTLGVLYSVFLYRIKFRYVCQYCEINMHTMTLRVLHMLYNCRRVNSFILMDAHAPISSQVLVIYICSFTDHLWDVAGGN